MRMNVGSIDRGIRIAIGMVLVSLTFIGPQSAWGFLGLIPLATGFVGWCPLYHVLGMDTCVRAPAPRSKA